MSEPLSNEENPPRMMISFPLITDGQDVELDVMNICVLSFRQLDGVQIDRILKYLTQRYERPF